MTIQRGAFGEVDDTFITEPAPWHNNATNRPLFIGPVNHRLGRSETRTLLRFELGFVPENAVAQSATLGLWEWGPSVGETVTMYQITQPWDNFAGNYDPYVWGSYLSASSTGWQNADATAWVSDWVEGTAPN